MRSVAAIALLAAFAGAGPAGRGPVVHLDELDLSRIRQGWGRPHRSRGMREQPLAIGGRSFGRGVGTHAPSECWLALDGRVRRFTALVGVDSAAGDARASLEFLVYGDDRLLWRSGLCRLGEAPRECRVELSGVRTLGLVVTDGGDGMEFDHADWAEAALEHEGDPPRVVDPPREEAVILTPQAPPSPRINGPRVCGVRPGSPFLFRIPCTGTRPLAFSARGLPPGLTLDSRTGIITGSLAAPGTHTVWLSARNRHGHTQRVLRIVAGQRLALTPPMGWNSWYIHYHRVSDRLLRQAADHMVASGMADYGYQYVNIDDCWMVKPGAEDPEIGGPPRDSAGRLRPNRRFPDMRALTDYIHSRGLKAGIYTSPGPRTCAGHEGSWGHEALDAQTFADWGFDFLKYDWCSYSEKAGGTTREHLMRPYRLMGTELQKQKRDIVFNLCQYGMGSVWEWGREVGHCWRTTGDLGLEGGSLSAGIYKVGLFNATLDRWAGPGGWNDPDYLLIGWVGDARELGQGRPTTLTPNEQLTHMSLWALMAAPLIFSGDMARLDPFTLSILCNPEIIDVDQDPLGRQGRIVRKTTDTLALVKDLEDGSRAVGLFNLTHATQRITVAWSELGVAGRQRVRDLWRQKDQGVRTESLDVVVPRRGVFLARLWPVR